MDNKLGRIGAKCKVGLVGERVLYRRYYITYRLGYPSNSKRQRMYMYVQQAGPESGATCQELTDSCTQKQKEGVSTLLQFSVYWIQLVNNPGKIWGKAVTLFYVYTNGIATLCTPFGSVRAN
jgi:hypothetical protein